VYPNGFKITHMTTSYGEQLEAALAVQVKVELVERSWTQKDLAEAVGVGRPAMNHYLKGHKSIPMPTFFRIAEALNVTPRELMARAEARIQPEAQTA
jgi:transcriptional regulator with XRE-family HTH domain